MATKWFKVSIPTALMDDARSAVKVASPKLGKEEALKLAVQQALKLKGSQTNLDKVTKWRFIEGKNLSVLEYSRKVTFKEVEGNIAAYNKSRGAA